MHAYIEGLNQKDAEELVAKADKVCPYSMQFAIILR